VELAGYLRFRPKLFDCLKAYDRATFAADAVAGVTVGIIALPLAMAFAIASGVKPEAGLFTAVIAGFVISALGGSRVQIGGPTGAFIVILYGIVAQYGLANLLICTMMAGVMLLAMGALRLGALIKFIPLPVIIGFTNGIAVLIFLSQIRDFLGLQTGPLPAEFFSLIRTLSAHLDTISWPTVALSVASLAALLVWPRRWATRLPAPVVVLVVGSAAAVLLALPVETIGSRFGGIPQTLPRLEAPHFSIEQLRNLVIPAFTIAMLGAIESLLCAVVADGMIHDRHDPNQELIAQGIANVITPFFGGIAATGAIARTSANIRVGAKTPVAGMIHAATLLGIMLVAAPLAKYIPLACLSAILVVVALHMADWRQFGTLRQYSRGRAGTLLVTFVLTVVLDLTIAVEVGLLWASLLLIRRMVQVTAVGRATDAHERIVGVEIYRAFGALFFGAADKVEILQRTRHPQCRVLVLDLDHVIYMDSTAANALESVHHDLKAAGIALVLCGAAPQPATMLRQSGVAALLGAGNVVRTRDEALARAREIVAATRE
jgi:SulP family sulfate permease